MLIKKSRRKLKNQTRQFIQDAKDQGNFAYLVPLKPHRMTTLNETLHNYYVANVNKFAHLERWFLKTQAYQAFQFAKQNGLDKESYHDTAGPECYLIRVTKNLAIKMDRDPHEDGFVAFISYIVNEESTTEDIDKLIKWLSRLNKEVCR